MRPAAGRRSPDCIHSAHEVQVLGAATSSRTAARDGLTRTGREPLHRTERQGLLRPLSLTQTRHAPRPATLPARHAPRPATLPARHAPNAQASTNRRHRPSHALESPNPESHRKETRLGHRTRRCPDHRRRRVRWRGGPAAGRGRVPGCLPRAGRLARQGRVPRARELDWELTARKQWSTSPNIRGLARGLPDRRDRRRRVAPDVRRGRRLDAHVRRGVAADAAVGLPGAIAGRRRRRLAADLRRAAPVLRAQRSAVRRLGLGGDPAYPAGARTPPCRRCRSAPAG